MSQWVIGTQTCIMECDDTRDRNFQLLEGYIYIYSCFHCDTENDCCKPMVV